MDQSPLFAGEQTPAVPPAPFPQSLKNLGAQLPETLFMGTSSWSYPGWEGLVYGMRATEAQLAQHGLPAYASHPLLRTVGIDRNFYQPLSVADYARYAAQVPEDFRFVVKAPNLVTDAVLRGAGGAPTGVNANFLDATIATEQFVQPCVEGLAERGGPLVFQFSPMPPELLADVPALVARLDAFLAALPPLPAANAAQAPFYALEFRDTALVTPRMMKMLAAHDARYCMALHPRMPPAARQLAAVAATGPGPLVVRWSLNAGLRFAEAETRYQPFDRIQDDDPATRETLVGAILDVLEDDHPAWIIAANNAEGCAPLTLHRLAKGLAELLPD